MQKSIQQMSDHYLVCGDNATTWYAVEELVETRRPVVADTALEPELTLIVMADHAGRSSIAARLEKATGVSPTGSTHPS